MTPSSLFCGPFSKSCQHSTLFNKEYILAANCTGEFFCCDCQNSILLWMFVYQGDDGVQQNPNGLQRTMQVKNTTATRNK